MYSVGSLIVVVMVLELTLIYLQGLVKCNSVEDSLHNYEYYYFRSSGLRFLHTCDCRL